MDPVATFNWVFENQPMASEILTQLSRYKRAEINFIADEKSPYHGDPGSYLVMHLYCKFIIYKITIKYVKHTKFNFLFF